MHNNSKQNLVQKSSSPTSFVAGEQKKMSKIGNRHMINRIIGNRDHATNELNSRWKASCLGKGKLSKTLSKYLLRLLRLNAAGEQKKRQQNWQPKHDKPYYR
jgi:hypothetical protein